MASPAKKPSKVTPPIDWETVTWPAERCRLLAVDQSLAHSGWVLLDYGDSIRPTVLDRDTIHTKGQDGLKGFADNFARGDILYGAFRALLLQTEPDAIVYEMPAITGRVGTFRSDSSMLAAMSLRCAAVSLGHRQRVAMQQAQHVKKVITGNGNATKPFVRECAMRSGVYEGRINEHISDALAIALSAGVDGSLARILGVASEAPSIGKVGS